MLLERNRGAVALWALLSLAVTTLCHLPTASATSGRSSIADETIDANVELEPLRDLDSMDDGGNFSDSIDIDLHVNFDGHDPNATSTSDSGDDDDDDDEYDSDDDDSGLDPTVLAQLQAKIDVRDLEILILDFVSDAEANDEHPPELQDILQHLSTEFGYASDVLEQYIETQPEIAQHILKSFVDATAAVREKKVEDFVDLFIDTMLDELRDGVPPDAILAQLGLQEHEFDEAIEALNHPEVLEALVEAQEEGINATIEYVTKAQESEFSVRRLRGEPDDWDELDDIEARKEEINKEYDQRRLRRQEYKEKTKAFALRIRDHHELVKHHGRRLADSCDGEEQSFCNAEKLRAMAEGRDDTNKQVDRALNPLLTLLDQLDQAEDTLRNIQLVADAVSLAVKIASNIPSFGSVFKAVDKAMVRVKDPLDDCTDKAKKFEDRVIDKWDQSIGRILELLDTFSRALSTAASAAEFIVDIKDSQCLVDVVSHIGSINMGSTENSIDKFTDYAEKVDDALDELLGAINNNPWKNIFNALKRLMNGLDPLFDFFEPFDPLANLLKKEIKLPWFKPPYTMKRLGNPGCRSSSYKLGAFDRCWEKAGNGWKDDWTSGGTRLAKLCHGEDKYHGKYKMGTDWLNNCKHRDMGYKKHKFWKGCNSKTYKKYCFFAGKCFKKKCPENMKLNSCGDYCIPKRRTKKSHDSSCSKHENKDKGIEAKKGFFGGCYRKCSKGDREFIGTCWPKAELRVSIKLIMDKVNSIINKIKDLPLLGEIYDAIDRLVGAILKPITNLINGWLKKAGIVPPSFPSVSVNLLPFNKVSSNMPGLPSFDMNFASKALSVIKDIMPVDISSCGTDVGCIMDKMGAPSMDNLLADMQNLFTTDKLDKISSALQSVVPGLTCTKWEEKSLPVSDLLKHIIRKDCDSCDVKIPMCVDMDAGDTAAITEIVRNVMGPVLNEVVDKINDVRRARELSIAHLPLDRSLVEYDASQYEELRKFLPVIAPGLQYTFAGFNKRLGAPTHFIGDPGRDSGRKDQDQPSVYGKFVSFTPYISFAFGFNYITMAHTSDGGKLYNPDDLVVDLDPINDFGMRFGIDVNIKYSTTGKLNALLQERLQWVTKMLDTSLEYYYRSPDTIYGLGWGICWDESSLSRYEGRWVYKYKQFPDAPLSITAQKRLCDYLRVSRNLVLKKKSGCEQKDLATWWNPDDDKRRKEGLECVKYWWEVQKKVEQEYMLKFKKIWKWLMKKQRGITLKEYNHEWYYDKAKDTLLWALDLRNLSWNSNLITHMLYGQMALGWRHAKYMRYSVSLMLSPVDYFELGFSLEFDIDEDGPKFFAISNGFTSINAQIEYSRLKNKFRKQQVPYKSGNAIVYKPRTVDWLPSIQFATHWHCHLDFNPYGGKLQGPVFFCPGMYGKDTA